MTALDVILIMASVYYFFQYRYEKLVYLPSEVESDSYYRAIYGTGEFSPEAIKQRKLEEELRSKEQQEAIENVELSLVKTPESPQVAPKQISTDNEVDTIVKQLQTEFNDSNEKPSLSKITSKKGKKEENNKKSEQLKMVIKNNQLLLEEKGDFLDIADLELATYQDFPKSSISDQLEGPQQWFVIVVGKEGEYLHVTDGTKKKWIHVGEESSNISVNDQLMLSVVNNGKIKEVNDVVIIGE